MSRINDRGEIIRDSTPQNTSGPNRPQPTSGYSCLPWFVVGVIILCLFFIGGSFVSSIFQATANGNTQFSNSETIDTSDSEPEVFQPQSESNQNTTESDSNSSGNSSDSSSSSLKPVPKSYDCPDINIVELQVGASGKVGSYDVSLRGQPIVPEVWDANIIRVLREGDRFYVIGGPECSHDGTWWMIRTDSGEEGWSREFLPSKGRLLLRIGS